MGIGVSHAGASRHVWRAVLAVCTSLGATGVKAASDLSEAEFLGLAQHCAPHVAPTTLASIARVESGYNLYAVHNNATGQSLTATGVEAGVATAREWLARGDSIDVGLMQINSKNFGWLGIGVEQAFDPCISLAAAAQILSDGFAGGHTEDEKQAALRTALSRYNTGSPERGFQNGYVDKVVAAAKQVVPAIRVDATDTVPDRQPPTSVLPQPARASASMKKTSRLPRMAAETHHRFSPDREEVE